MSPGSSSGITSFSFCVAASQCVTEMSSSDQQQPTSGLVLCSGFTKTATASLPATDHLSALPTTLLYLIKHFLIGKDSLQLILTNHRLNTDVQAYYKMMLRPTVAQQCASPIASCRDLVNRRAQFVPMRTAGEWMFQRCMSLKASAENEVDYGTIAIAAYTKRRSTVKSALHLKDLSTGVTLGLGGRLMPAPCLDKLLANILACAKTRSDRQMGAMILGLGVAIGGSGSMCEQHHTVLDKILASGETCTDYQMGVMIQALACTLGGKAMTAEVRHRLV